MNDDVTAYIDSTQPWQVEVCRALREAVHRNVPNAEEALRYGKPHFLRDGSHVAALHVAPAKVSFMVFGAQDIDPVPGVLRPLGSGDRKVVDVRQGQAPDLDLIADVLRRTAGHT
jgi:hypothetical protein